jgi:sec-independent protein translocase protein TatA
MFGLGPIELAIILAIVVVLLGARRLPEIGAATGQALRNLKSGLSGKSAEDEPPDAPDVADVADVADVKERDEDEPGSRR